MKKISKNQILVVVGATFLALPLQIQAGSKNPTPSTKSEIKPIKLLKPLTISIGGATLGPASISPARDRIITPEKEVKLKPALGVGIKIRF